ncbi:hypothetical protein TNCV_467341 [Trichonephila clavipes]|nr:hypothetical protein TNCV_467341 [Trichonephila clavipes]
MRWMQNGSKPSIQMVYEACSRAEARPSVELPGRLSLPERIPTPPAQRPERLVAPERPAEPEIPPLVDPSVFMNNVEVTPPLITRCDKGTQIISPYLLVKCLDLGKRRMELPQANKRLSI